MPKVSICIPAYKQPENLLRALTSVFVQTFKDYEVIITDDSPDDSVGLIVKEFSQHSNLRYYKNKIRKGSPENWNESVRLATGKYIKFLHHDDWFSNENSLAVFVNMLDQNPNSVFAFCPSLNCGLDGKLRYVNKISESQLQMLQNNPKVLFKGNFIGAPSATIYRRQINQEFDPRMKWLVDFDFYIRVLADRKGFEYTRQPLVCIALESSGKVTDECSGNKRIEVFEYLYMYTKISNNRLIDYQLCKVLLKVFDRFNIQYLQDILDCGIDFALPKEVKYIVFFRRIFKRQNQLESVKMALFFMYLKFIQIKLRWVNL